jgi:hypothetical protein
MLNTTLSDLVRMLKAECGFSLEAGVSTFSDDRFRLLLSNKQKSFANMFDWPELNDTWDLPVTVGNDTVAEPTEDMDGNPYTLDFQRPFALFTLYGNIYKPVLWGIDDREWNTRLTQSTFFERYDFFCDTDGDYQFRLWPLTTVDQTLRLQGQRALRSLTADADKADLDDLLLVYSVAADLAMEGEMKNAPMKAAMAKDRYRMLTQGLPNREGEPLVLGANSISRPSYRKARIIAIAP